VRRSKHVRVKAEFIIELDREHDGIPWGIDPRNVNGVFEGAMRAMLTKGVDGEFEVGPVSILPEGRLSVGLAYSKKWRTAPRRKR
jgi:hypothetical protein